MHERTVLVNIVHHIFENIAGVHLVPVTLAVGLECYHGNYMTTVQVASLPTKY